MSEWSVGAIGANAHAASFQGAALKVARMLEIPSALIDQFMEQQRVLTSPYPLIEGVKPQQFAVADVSRDGGFTPAGQNSGRGGHSLA